MDRSADGRRHLISSIFAAAFFVAAGVHGGVLPETTRGAMLGEAGGGPKIEDPTPAPQTPLGEGAFKKPEEHAGLHSYTGGGKGAILASEDAGKTWKAIRARTNFVVSSVAGPSAEKVFVGAAGGGHGDGDFLLLRNGAWKSQQLFRPVYGLFFLDEKNGWAVCSPRTVMIMGAGGLHFLDTKGVILVTRDSGDTWACSAPEIARQLLGIHFVDDHRGWAVGAKGTILRSEDGGIKWTPQVSGTENHLLGVRFADDKVGWAVGSKSTILFTGDGGNTWTAQASGVEADLSAVHVFDRKRALVVGAKGTVLTTGDGGATWSKVDVGVSADLNGMGFAADKSLGFIVGGEGTILRTEDGGKSWAPAKSETQMVLRGVAVFGKSAVYAVGDDGAITSREGGLVITGRGGGGMPMPPAGGPYLGIRPDRKDVEGFPVASVEPGGPADKAGVKAGDVIVSFDGKPLKSFMDLIKLVQERKPGDEVEIVAKRGDEQVKMKVTVGKRGG